MLKYMVFCSNNSWGTSNVKILWRFFKLCDLLDDELLYTLPMDINGYVPSLILLYTLPMNINGYVPSLILLYTLPMNINRYVPFLTLLYTLPMNINGYVPFLILLYTLHFLFPGLWGASFEGSRRGRRYFWILPDVWAAALRLDPL